MPPFPKPSFEYAYNVATQIAALRNYRDTKPGRAIPAKASDRLLVASWNIANLGLQERRERDYRLLAEMISWFDLVAIQEVNDNLVGLRGILRHLASMPAGGSWRTLFSDKAGNNERLAYIYDASKVTVCDKVGEIAIPPSEQRYIRVDSDSPEFRGFDRNPYLAAFQCGAFDFVIVNVHLYFGSDSAAGDIARRRNETYAVGRWADLRRSSDYSYSPETIVIGDFNMPQAEWGDPIYDALVARGLYIPAHSTEVGGTNLAGDKHYDQIAFFPGATEMRNTAVGVFDFDGALFAHLWQTRRAEFREYMRYYISDHRLLWAEFKTA
jgi:endonuclease/exonuclease/phosphatase family metal-dependent hydrolase